MFLPGLLFFYNKILGRGSGSTQSKGRAPNSWSTGVCPCGLWSMTSKPFLSVHTRRLLPVSLSYWDASASAAMETQQSVTPQDRTRDVVVNLTLIVQSLCHWTHERRWVKLKLNWKRMIWFHYSEKEGRESGLWGENMGNITNNSSGPKYL